MFSTDIAVWLLLEAYPEIDQVFAWYGVVVSRAEMNFTLKDLADEYGVDLDDLLVDLQSAVGIDIEEQDDRDPYDSLDEDEDADDEPTWEYDWHVQVSPLPSRRWIARR